MSYRDYPSALRAGRSDSLLARMSEVDARMSKEHRMAAGVTNTLIPSGRPVLKWAGGKTQLLPEIVARLPRNYNRYHEPFVGSGAVFFALAPENSTLSDSNHHLIALYKDIRDSTELLTEQLEALENEFNLLTEEAKSDHYYRCREEFNANGSAPARQSALMVYLNKAGFNGIYRENAKGGFNVPFGKKRELRLPGREHLEACRDVLASSELIHQGYESVLSRARKADLVYFDPPYVPLSATSSFTAYQAKGFTLDDQKHLADVVRELDSRGVSVLLSNSDTETVRELYQGLHIETVMARRNINSKGGGRGQVAEVLVRNY